MVEENFRPVAIRGFENTVYVLGNRQTYGSDTNPGIDSTWALYESSNLGKTWKLNHEFHSNKGRYARADSLSVGGAGELLIAGLTCPYGGPWPCLGGGGTTAEISLDQGRRWTTVEDRASDLYDQNSYHTAIWGSTSGRSIYSITGKISGWEKKQALAVLEMSSEIGNFGRQWIKLDQSSGVGSGLVSKRLLAVSPAGKIATTELGDLYEDGIGRSLLTKISSDFGRTWSVAEYIDGTKDSMEFIHLVGMCVGPGSDEVSVLFTRSTGQSFLSRLKLK